MFEIWKLKCPPQMNTGLFTTTTPLSCVETTVAGVFRGYDHPLLWSY